MFGFGCRDARHRPVRTLTPPYTHPGPRCAGAVRAATAAGGSNATTAAVNDGSVLASAGSPWLDTSKPIDERVELLLSRMNSYHKVRQLQSTMAGPVYQLGISRFNYQVCGMCAIVAVCMKYGT